MEDFKKHLAAQERSGKSVNAYCQQHGIDPKRLYYWRRRGKRQGKFVEVGGMSAKGYELKLRDGISLLVPDNFDAAELKRLLEALGC